MLKRRTIAMLVAGTLVGAQAGIAANEEIMGSETYLVPVEQVVILEPVVLSETDVMGPTSDLVVIEHTSPTMYVAAAEPTRDYIAATEPVREPRPVVKHERTFAPAGVTYSPTAMPFKGHPMNVSETAGWTQDMDRYQQQRFTQYPDRDFRGTAGRDYRSAASFPMNVSETAGANPQALEKQRLAQAGSSDYTVAVWTAPAAKVE